MGHNFIFVALGNDADDHERVSLERVRNIFSRFQLVLPLLVEGSNEVSLATPLNAAIPINETACFVIKAGDVASFSIHRPNSGPPGRHLWHSLITELNFILLPTYGGPAFASAETIRRAPYLSDPQKFPGGVKVVTYAEDLP